MKHLPVWATLALLLLTPQLASATDNGKYFLNLSSPTEITFFCEQQGRIVFVDSDGIEKYISKDKPDISEPVIPRENCGMGRCNYFDVLGNYVALSIRCSLDFSDDTHTFTEEVHMAKCAEEEKQRQKFVDHLQTAGFNMKDADLRLVGGSSGRDGCRETVASSPEQLLGDGSVICVTGRRTIYLHSSGEQGVYTTFDFKSSNWEKPSTDLSSKHAKWEIEPNQVSAIEFEKKEYQYRFEITRIDSLPTGTVSVFKDGNNLQTESCKLLYFNPALLSAPSK
jgi:hypothetical protein